MLALLFKGIDSDKRPCQHISFCVIDTLFIFYAIKTQEITVIHHLIGQKVDT